MIVTRNHAIPKIAANKTLLFRPRFSGLRWMLFHESNIALKPKRRMMSVFTLLYPTYQSPIINHEKYSYPIMLKTAIAAVSVRRMFWPRLTR